MKHCFMEALAFPESAIQDSLAYQSIPEWDSTAHMALVAILEQEFDVMLDTDDIIALSTVGKAREILVRYGVDF